MSKPCRKCGQPFSPVKPWHVICFDCHMSAIRENVTERVTPRKNTARAVTNTVTKSGNPAPK